MCGVSPETIDHILKQCPFAQAVWFNSPLTVNFSACDIIALPTWISKWVNLMSRDKKSGRETICISSFLCWFIWRARNASRMDQISQSPLEICNIACSAYEEFKNASPVLSQQSQSKPPSPMATQRWTTPPPQVYKLNCDASLSVDGVYSGVGYVIRNHQAQIIVAVSALLSFSSAIQGLWSFLLSNIQTFGTTYNIVVGLVVDEKHVSGYWFVFGGSLLCVLNRYAQIPMWVAMGAKVPSLRA
ncbi:uncharacterized protein LOC122088193 [Macadamia integrifolia]|uniref:uncharacterized protein LOC122088193 n=1 Tax=Macadamia integrifolia TaxID=60698 RepID=UPI001C4E5C4A|nr:uncharacterized protein LOC122088193 [Macadamia integrifolia]